jgi:DinB superfamily
METGDLLIDAFGRVHEVVHQVVNGLTVDDLHDRPDRDANSIAWLVWHLTRIEDDHVADLAGCEQLWTAAGWRDRFDLPFDASATGYGFTSDDVAAVRVASPHLLLDYHDAVHALVLSYLARVDGTEFDRIVDTAWDPPVTAGVRIVSVISDALQHAGQAAYVRGLIERS